jgi:hypothetical protein
MTRQIGQRRRDAQGDLAAWAASMRRPGWPIPPIGVLVLVGLVVAAIAFAVAK